MKTKIPAIVLLLLTLPLVTACEEGEVIETIGNKTITTSDFENFYSTAIEQFVMKSGVDKASLFVWMCDPTKLPIEELRPGIRELRPESIFKSYHDVVIVEQVALSEGFDEDPLIKEILEQNRRQVLAQLYIQHELNRKIKITEEEKLELCQTLRERRPDVIGPLPLDTCKMIAEGELKKRYFFNETPNIINEIREKVQVQKNENFDLDEFLENGMQMYQDIKKEGGCDPTETGASGDGADDGIAPVDAETINSP
ncbi:MAG: hypothetical protein KDK30_09520 [Leptospiraceae bacterium]|nr:hypothetical protein [Leptospiraceae bacterium]MCB1321070.1 hypothetical protein [Leptospiraceae bacterium]